MPTGVLIGIIIAVIVGAVAIYLVLLSKGLNSGVRDLAESELGERRKSIKVSRVSGFMPSKYRAFYEVLKVAMPSHYVILPNIAIELLFTSSNRKELQLEGQYVSFCVFTKDFKPILVIDLKDFSDASNLVFSLTDTEKELIQNLGLPILEHEVRDHYSVDELRRSIAKAMNPLYAER